MSTDGPFRRYDLHDLTLLEVAIRSSTYLQYLAYGIDLSDPTNADFKALVVSELFERLEAEAQSIETFRGLGSSGEEFPIYLMRWGCIYFVEAGELDRLGYYMAPEGARAEAFHFAECFLLAAGEDADPSLPNQPRPRSTIRAWYTSDLLASHCQLDDPVGDLVISIDEAALLRIRSGDEVYVARPWVAFEDGQAVRAIWRFNMRGRDSAAIWVSCGNGEEPEVLEVTSMQFGEDPTIYAAPPLYEE